MRAFSAVHRRMRSLIVFGISLHRRRVFSWRCAPIHVENAPGDMLSFLALVPKLGFQRSLPARCETPSILWERNDESLSGQGGL